MKFKAALFDLDGTLVDSLADLRDSMNQVLRQLGLPEHPPDAYRFFVGEGIRVLTTRALPEPMRTEAVIDRCSAMMLEVYLRRLVVHTRPYDGIPQLLDGLVAPGARQRRIRGPPRSHPRHTRCAAGGTGRQPGKLPVLRRRREPGNDRPRSGGRHRAGENRAGAGDRRPGGGHRLPAMRACHEHARAQKPDRLRGPGHCAADSART